MINRFLSLTTGEIKIIRKICKLELISLESLNEDPMIFLLEEINSEIFSASDLRAESDKTAEIFKALAEDPHSLPKLPLADMSIFNHIFWSYEKEFDRESFNRLKRRINTVQRLAIISHEN